MDLLLATLLFTLGPLSSRSPVGFSDRQEREKERDPREMETMGEPRRCWDKSRYCRCAKSHFFPRFFFFLKKERKVSSVKWKRDKWKMRKDKNEKRTIRMGNLDSSITTKQNENICQFECFYFLKLEILFWHNAIDPYYRTSHYSSIFFHHLIYNG